MSALALTFFFPFLTLNLSFLVSQSQTKTVCAVFPSLPIRISLLFRAPDELGQSWQLGYIKALFLIFLIAISH